MKNIEIILLNILLFYCCNIDAQSNNYPSQLPNVIPLSPQAATFARYGEYPVSLSTGVPQIEIPLYEINWGDIRVPITISYHASGIKVEDIATPVGLGWTLNWGGSIIREICGEQDEQGYSNGRLANRSEALDFINNNGLDEIRTTFGIKGINNTSPYPAIPINTLSDRYIYNFNGHSGVFRYNAQTKEIVTIPYAPIKIIHTTDGFKITDTNGLIYTFEEKESSGLSYYTPVTGWYLTKIESLQTGKIVTFKYITGSGYSSDCPVQTASSGIAYEPSPSPYEDFGIPKNLEGFPFEGDNMFWANSVMVYNTPKLLDEINFGSKKIKLTYTNDRLDKYKDRLNSITISANGANMKNIVFDNNYYWGNNTRNYRMQLKGIEVKGENNFAVGEKYSFLYNNQNLPPYVDLSAGYRVPEGDYWGYANTTYSTVDYVPRDFAPSIYQNPPTYFGANRNPDETYMKDCILQEITYPTGGKTSFEFEANRVPNAYSYNSSEAVVGGLRIKKITSTTNNGNTLTKTYDYQGSPSVRIQPETFIDYNQKRIYVLQVEGSSGIDLPELHYQDWKTCSSNARYSLTGWNQNPVFYNQVTEYFGEETGNSGKKVYTFQNNIRNLDYYPDYLIGEDLYKFWGPYANVEQGIPTPLLNIEETYESTGNNNYSLKRKIENSYSGIDKGTIICGVTGGLRDEIINVENVYWNTAEYFPYETRQDNIERLAVYETVAYRYFYLLNSTTTTDFNANGNTVSTVTYNYDQQHRLLTPIKTTIKNSNGVNVIEETKHPFNFSTAPYPEMVTNNIIDPVVSKSKTENSSVQSIHNIFRKDVNKFVIDNIQLGINSALETRLAYSNYDKFGNPTYFIKDNSEKIVYLWSYEGQYPIANIRNATFEQVKAALGYNNALIDALADNLSPDVNAIGTLLRNNLPAAFVTTYTYKPLVGMTSETDPNGVSIYYEYDGFGRLKYVKDDDGNILKSHEYHYKE